MPLRDPTPDELKELGVNLATPASTAPVAPSSQYDQPTNFRALSDQMSQQAAATSNPLTYNAPPPTTMDKVVLGMGPAMATTALGGNLLKGAVPVASKLAPYAEAAGQGLGNMALEGFNYLTQPPEEKPTLTGATLRSAAQTAIPLGFGALAKGLAPLSQKLTPMLSEIPAQSKEVLGKVGSAIKTVVRKGLGETTAARITKDAMLADLEARGTRLPVAPIVQALKDKFVPYAESEMKGLIGGLQKAAEPLDNSISLPKFQELVRAAHNQARTPAAKSAFNAFNEEFKTSVAQHIAEHAQGGQAMAQQFLDTFGETTRRLGIFERMNKLVGDVSGNKPGRQAINVVKGLLYDDTAKQALKALDTEAGTKFLPQIEALAQESAAIERRAAERGAAAESNAALISAQKRARAILYGIAGTMGGGAVRGVLGGGGGLVGSEIASWLMSRILGESGAILPERLAAQGVSGLAKAAPAATAAANQATRGSGRAKFDEVQGGGGTPK